MFLIKKTIILTCIQKFGNGKSKFAKDKQATTTTIKKTEAHKFIGLYQFQII